MSRAEAAEEVVVDVSSTQASIQAGPRELAEFIRARHAEILDEWERIVAALPIAQDLDRASIIDHIPTLLVRIAQMADDLGEGKKVRIPADLAELHALARLEEGFDLEHVISEFAILRDCIMRLWIIDCGIDSQAYGVRALHQAIDRAIAASVERYTVARDRTLYSLDRLSAAALETRSLDEFLERLLRVLLETTAAVDTATILLREGDLLRVRASVGMEEEVANRFALRFGEGFSGTIAATRRAHHLRSASTDPLLISESLRSRGIRGLFGIPLVDGDEVIGVAHMGSLTANEFSLQDRQLFAAMASRATAAISQHMLRDSAERRAKEQQAVANLGSRALAASNVAAVLDDAVHTITETLHVEMCLALSLEPDGILVAKAESGWGKDVLQRIRMPVTGESLASAVLRAREPVIVDELADNARYTETATFRKRGVRSAIGVPIRLPGPGERIHGILTAQSRQSRSFGAEHAAFMQSCANVIGSAIELHVSADQRARLLEQEQAAREESERTLALLDSLLQAASLGIGFVDTQLRYVRVNEALAQINSKPVAAHRDRKVRDVVTEPIASLIEPMLLNVMATRETIKNVEVSSPPTTPPAEMRSYLITYVPVQTAQGDLLGAGAAVVDITDRKRMEVQLREREVELQTLADNIPQLAWMAEPDGTVSWTNQRWVVFTGVEAPDVMEKLEHIVGSEHYPSMYARYSQHIATGEAWEDIFPMRDRDGRCRWFLTRAVPIRDDSGRVVRWLGTNTDVTEQRLMAEVTTVLSSSLDYKHTLELLGALVVPTLGDYCLIHLSNESQQRIFNITSRHANPAPPNVAAFAESYEPSWNAPYGIARVVRTGVPELVSTISDDLLVERVRDAETLREVRTMGFTSLMIVPLVARNKILGALTLLTAESGRHYTQHDLDVATELGRRAGLAVDNARLYEESQRETRIREDVLAVVSHDLKNPLGAIHLAATLLLEQPDPRYRKHLETIYRAATRMDHLIGDLLDMASIQAGRLALERKREEADTLVREVADLHEPMILEKGLHLNRSVGDLVGKFLFCDHDRVLQVFGNLLGNAIKFCGAGDEIAIKADVDDNHVRFAVSDTGPGIAAHELPHIFQPYWSAKRHAKKGTGLGLFITKGIIEAHGGRIWVESAPGKGTTFYFTLPLA